ncbi:response regulator transcription factor [Actinomadura luteofluorescens]|uniref:DNA-binding NarL/FixJ family response regulator n=1 Tax=Actinomadura luteofluorescens TaxID=46163 RepID=A0A7Y9EKX0_9ACTN|nr:MULTISPECIES: response regulator transcription factor [Actinomadura]MCR3741787.1 two component transcriptional regulator, LuxR family [Actinomadura glauciflava]NYD49620.1 DNA-binding NarL/FixJ family response regulator [Actinomadura luteofluorescens]
MLRVMIVDDHPIVREGLRGMLAAETDIEVAAEAASGDEAVAVVPSVGPDVILMDLRMPSGDGVSAIERLPGHRILVLTTFQEDAGIVRAIEAGAAGYLLKDASRADLAAAVRDVAAGRRVLSPEVSARLAAAGEARPPVLSARESQVLALVAEGLTNAEIGARLYIGQATVKTHLLRIFGKLGVSDRTAAVMAALEHGILPAP